MKRSIFISLIVGALPFTSLLSQSLETHFGYTSQNHSPSSLLHLQVRSQLLDFAKTSNRSWGPELQAGRWILISDATSPLRPHWNILVGLAFTEFFGAQSFRAALGLGAVRTETKWRAAFDYRLGIGQSLGASPWRINLDLMGRHIWNKSINQSINHWGAGIGLQWDFS